mmetsp:Transcript_9045/g.25980  ORF Transcript_9045/g.25980 Transcript_9045/m.25980 type:complete len:249 (+) Transcript_9045:143-889(+)
MAAAPAARKMVEQSHVCSRRSSGRAGIMFVELAAAAYAGLRRGDGRGPVERMLEAASCSSRGLLRLAIAAAGISIQRAAVAQCPHAGHPFAHRVRGSLLGDFAAGGLHFVRLAVSDGSEVHVARRCLVVVGQRGLREHLAVAGQAGSWASPASGAVRGLAGGCWRGGGVNKEVALELLGSLCEALAYVLVLIAGAPLQLLLQGLHLVGEVYHLPLKAPYIGAILGRGVNGGVRLDRPIWRVVSGGDIR